MQKIDKCFWLFFKINSFLQDKDLKFVEIKAKGILIWRQNLAQRLMLESVGGSIRKWIEKKKRNRYLHSDSQNEILK